MRRLTPEPYQEYFGIMIPVTGIKKIKIMMNKYNSFVL